MPKTVALSPRLKSSPRSSGGTVSTGVLDATDLTRALYSSDASLYRVVPRAVAQPRTVEELAAVLDAARAPSACR